MNRVRIFAGTATALASLIGAGALTAQPAAATIVVPCDNPGFTRIDWHAGGTTGPTCLADGGMIYTEDFPGAGGRQVWFDGIDSGANRVQTYDPGWMLLQDLPPWTHYWQPSGSWTVNRVYIFAP